MKSIVRLIVCLLLLIGWGLAGLSLHVVVTPEEIPITLITKERFGITDTYVDTRTWTLDDVAAHKPLVQKLILNGKADALRHVIKDEKAGDIVTQLTETLKNAPRQAESDSKLPLPTTAGNGRSVFGLPF